MRLSPLVENFLAFGWSSGYALTLDMIVSTSVEHNRGLKGRGRTPMLSLPPRVSALSMD